VNRIIPILKDYSFKSKSTKIKNQICYVGRFAPNKKIEHFVFLIFYMRKISTTYSLVLIGKVNPVLQEYYKDILQLIDDLELKDSIHIFHDLDDKQVDEKISASELFVSMSEHEGFGIPILDAIANHTLVFAFYSSAIIEMLQDSGIYFYNKNFPEIAKTIHELINDHNNFAKQIQKQEDRLRYFQNYPFLDNISALVNSI
jgi:glycosyltransferase involved in cell wall biosynthesis